MIARLVREPLLHFAVLGAALFIAYAWIAPPGTDSPHIVVSSDQLRSIEAQFAGTWRRPPSDEEMKNLVDNFVRAEVLYREGVAMGLDRDDPVVRNRIKLKMEFLGEDTLSTEPTDAELQQWFASNPSRFELPARTSFEQVFFDPARHAEALPATMARALAGLKDGTASAALGDRTMLPRESINETPEEIAKVFGAAFADAVAALDAGTWSGPVASTFGMHLVRVSARARAQMPTFDDARDTVRREWTRERSQEIREKFYQSIRAKYTVTVEPRTKDVASSTR